MSALDGIDAWPADHAGVAVLTPSGEVVRHGRTELVGELASVTKPLAAYAVLVGVEEGAVSLDDPAGPPGATLRHLLAHTAGYGFESDAGVLARPGTRRIYSNRGIEEAAAHLERAAGVAFGDYLAEAVLAPLGMTSTTLEGSPAAAGRSSVDDLARFAAELLAPRLLDPATVAEMTTVQFPGLVGVLPGHGRYTPLDWGLGVDLNFGRVGHWGGTLLRAGTFGHFGGAGTWLWVDAGRRLACVGVTDHPFDRWAASAWPPFMDGVVREFARPGSPQAPGRAT